MVEQDAARLDSDDVQRLANVLDDTQAAPHTRAAILKRAVVGAAAVGVLGPAGSALAASRQNGADTIESVVTTAVTAEALAVTFLTEAVRRLPGTKAAPFRPVLRAANTSEFLHYAALSKLGGKPVTTRFWLPEALYGNQLRNLFASIEVAETVFVNAYLVGITVFAGAGKPDLARYAGEILGVEAEHRTLARFARGQIEGPGKVQVPNNKAFETYALKTTAQHVKALQDVGIGFGQQGKRPGKFFNFPGDPRRNGTGSALIAPTPA